MSRMAPLRVMVSSAIPAAGITVSATTSPDPAMLVSRIGLPWAVMLLGMPEESGTRRCSPDQGHAGSIRDGQLATFEVDGGGRDPRNPKAATGAALRSASADALGIALNRAPSASLRYTRRGEGHHATDVHCGIGPEEKPGRVHQEEIGIAKSGRLYGSKDIRDVPTRDTPEYV